MVHALNNLFIFDACSKPDIGKHVGDFSLNEGAHSLRALRQNLIVVMGRCTHYIPYFENERITDTLVEKVAHRIDEDLFRLLPSQWNVKCTLIFANYAVPNCTLAAATSETFVFFDVHSLQSSRHLHGVTIGATGADNRASRDRIPSGISPFDLCFGHWSLRLSLVTLAYKIAKSPYKGFRSNFLTFDAVAKNRYRTK